MDWNSLSVIAAWWGAVIATVLLGWDFIKWKMKGPRIKVSASKDMKLFGDFTSPKPDVIWKDVTVFRIRVVNRGDSATTLTSVVAATFATKAHRFFGKADSKIICFELPTGNSLPRLLDPGEQWMGLFDQDKLLALEEMKGKRNVYFEVFHSHSDKPARAKLSFL